MKRDDLPRTQADEEILASDNAVPPEILAPSAASIVASHREARENADTDATPEPDGNTRRDKDQ